MSETVSIDDSVDDEGEPASNIVTIAIFESGDFSIALGREGGEDLEGVTFGEAIQGVTELMVSDVVVMMFPKVLQWRGLQWGYL